MKWTLLSGRHKSKQILGRSFNLTAMIKHKLICTQKIKILIQEIKLSKKKIMGSPCFPPLKWFKVWKEVRIMFPFYEYSENMIPQSVQNNVSFQVH